MEEPCIVKIFDGRYEVTSDGDIFSNINGRKYLKGGLNYSGYRRVVLFINGKRVCKTVHRLVAESFIENPRKLCEINHKNGIKKDNRVENLEWCSRKNNLIHSINNGLVKSKINKEIAQEIKKEFFKNKFSQRRLASMFGISQTQIRRVLKDKAWKL